MYMYNAINICRAKKSSFLSHLSRDEFIIDDLFLPGCVSTKCEL